MFGSHFSQFRNCFHVHSSYSISVALVPDLIFHLPGLVCRAFLESTLQLSVCKINCHIMAHKVQNSESKHVGNAHLWRCCLYWSHTPHGAAADAEAAGYFNLNFTQFIESAEYHTFLKGLLPLRSSTCFIFAKRKVLWASLRCQYTESRLILIHMKHLTSALLYQRVLPESLTSLRLIDETFIWTLWLCLLLLRWSNGI